MFILKLPADQNLSKVVQWPASNKFVDKCLYNLIHACYMSFPSYFNSGKEQIFLVLILFLLPYHHHHHFTTTTAIIIGMLIFL